MQFYVYCPLRRECFLFEFPANETINACDFESAQKDGELMEKKMLVAFKTSSLPDMRACKTSCQESEPWRELYVARRPVREPGRVHAQLRPHGSQAGQR